MKKIITILVLLLSCSYTIAKPIDVTYDDGIYHIVLTGNKIKKQIKMVSAPTLITNNDAHKKTGSILTINTGFFDPNNQKTISYILSDTQIIEDPLFNENLIYNPNLSKNLKKILNRTEFRILNCDNKLKYEIAQHNSKVDFLCSIQNSAQAGPQLLPNLRIEEENFIAKDNKGNIIRESASVLHKTARTLIGIKNLDENNQELHIFIVTIAHPMDIYESRDLCAKYKLDSAMAFDGGSSTSFNYKDINVVSTQHNGDTGRALKSFMIIKKK